MLPNIADRQDLAGKRVIVRTPLNAPIEEGKVLNDFRIVRALETVKLLTDKGARVILVSHLSSETETTLRPVFEVLERRLPAVHFCAEIFGAETEQTLANLKDGEVALIENLRVDPREKANDTEFAKALAAYGDIYVNDDFTVSHRQHASLVELPKLLPAYFSPNFIAEYTELQKSLSPEHPSLFCLGGAKFDTKMPLVEKFLDLYDEVFIGGAIVNDFFKAKGFEVGQSLVSDIDLSNSPLLAHPKIILPVDVTIDGPNGTRICSPEEVAAEESILDAGPATIAMLKEKAAAAKMILWNGPLGNYEGGFGEQTEALAKVIANSDASSVVGGGDTVAAIENLGISDQFTFVSTAGGAMLQFLEDGTLPAIEVILQKHE